MWEAAGRRIAASLDDVSAAIVVGDDPVATACVALGIGRYQALRRRVAVGDMIGDAPPLRALVTDDDPHGLVDSFVFGVSLNRIARQVDAAGNLYILPSGADSVLQAELLHDDRWRRLAAGFREVGALLLLAAPAQVPGIDALARAMEGVVVVGDASPPVGRDKVIADVPRPGRRPNAESLRAVRREPPPPPRAPEPTPAWRSPLAAAALVLLLGAAAAAFAFRDRLGLTARAETAVDSAAFAPPPVVAAPSTPDTSAGTTAASADATSTLAAANVGDSATAAAYGVEIGRSASGANAALRIRRLGTLLPTSTFAPVGDSASGFRIIAGAFADRRSADSLLAALRMRRTLAPGSGAVVRAPFALLLDSMVVRETAPNIVATYIARGIPAYALLQDDGFARVYAGAFESAEQAARLAENLRNANIDATLVYRVGRTF